MSSIVHLGRHALASFAIVVLSLLTACGSVRPAIDVASLPTQAGASENIATYHARFGRSRPVIAVVGDNHGTELTDFMVPYGVLSESGVAEVVAVSTQSGPMKTFTDLGQPAFRIVAQATLAEFDVHHPDGADYVVVPAQNAAPELLRWLAEQTHKGGVLVSICNGAMVVAETGVMAGRHATAHWSTESHRLQTQGSIHWVKNVRYVSDGNWISSAGVSASIPTSLALVEAIAGHQRAAMLAETIGASPWTARHNSDAFHPHIATTGLPLAKVVYTNRWFHGKEELGILAPPGVDEASLALTVDAFSSTGRSHAYLVPSAEMPLRTRHGLTLLPEHENQDPVGAKQKVVLPVATPAGKALDIALAGIAQRYGRTTASGVAIVLEYPDFN
ncbi:MAG: DJ-1/PfpI family protein [Proteobacteria bacterium]|nr:DJ-1/PfpI family protein [Pseudomonadota bacterium]